MRRNRLIIVLELVAVVLLCCSCDNKTAYNNYEPVSVEGWERSDTVVFEDIVIKTTADYKEEIGLRINDAFPYLNLFLVVDQEIRPGNILRRDTINCSLMDNEGNIKGNGLSFYQYSFPLTALRLNSGDTLNIRVRHNMRREILPGIANIGMKISR